VARRATKINELRSSSAHLLLLDAGNSLSNQLSSANEAAASNGGRTAVEALNRLGYDAVALGYLDLDMGREALQQRIGEAEGFEFVSANVADKAGGQLLVKPYVIKEVGGHRVALIGITGPSSAPDFTVAPALDAAKTYVAKARAEADIVILLSNAGVEANKAIAAQVPGVDLIVSGGQGQLLTAAEPAPGTLVVQATESSAGSAGRVLGRLEASFDRAGNMRSHSWQGIQLGPSIPDDPDIAAWLATLPKP